MTALAPKQDATAGANTQAAFFAHLEQLREQVIAGRHPSIKLPQSAIDELLANQHDNVSARVPVETTVSVGTHTPPPKKATKPQYDLQRAELQLKRKRLEKALREEVARTSTQDPPHELVPYLSTVVSVEAILEAAHKIEKPVSGIVPPQPPQAKPVEAPAPSQEKAASSSSFDENQYYSSAANSWSSDLEEGEVDPEPEKRKPMKRAGASHTSPKPPVSSEKSKNTPTRTKDTLVGRRISNAATNVAIAPARTSDATAQVVTSSSGQQPGKIHDNNSVVNTEPSRAEAASTTFAAKVVPQPPGLTLTLPTSPAPQPAPVQIPTEETRAAASPLPRTSSPPPSPPPISNTQIRAIARTRESESYSPPSPAVPVFRNNLAAPVAPQPSRISPLAVNNVPQLTDAALSSSNVEKQIPAAEQSDSGRANAVESVSTSQEDTQKQRPSAKEKRVQQRRDAQERKARGQASGNNNEASGAAQNSAKQQPAAARPDNESAVVGDKTALAQPVQNSRKRRRDDQAQDKARPAPNNRGGLAARGSPAPVIKSEPVSPPPLATSDQPSQPNAEVPEPQWWPKRLYVHPSGRLEMVNYQGAGAIDDDADTPTNLHGETIGETVSNARSGPNGSARVRRSGPRAAAANTSTLPAVPLRRVASMQNMQSIASHSMAQQRDNRLDYQYENAYGRQSLEARQAEHADSIAYDPYYSFATSEQAPVRRNKRRASPRQDQHYFTAASLPPRRAAPPAKRTKIFIDEDGVQWEMRPLEPAHQPIGPAYRTVDPPLFGRDGAWDTEETAFEPRRGLHRGHMGERSTRALRRTRVIEIDDDEDDDDDDLEMFEMPPHSSNLTQTRLRGGQLSRRQSVQHLVERQHHPVVQQPPAPVPERRVSLRAATMQPPMHAHAHMQNPAAAPMHEQAFNPGVTSQRPRQRQQRREQQLGPQHQQAPPPPPPPPPPPQHQQQWLTPASTQLPALNQQHIPQSPYIASFNEFPAAPPAPAQFRSHSARPDYAHHHLPMMPPPPPPPLLPSQPPHVHVGGAPARPPLAYVPQGLSAGQAHVQAYQQAQLRALQAVGGLGHANANVRAEYDPRFPHGDSGL